jgi:hypothetical protein
MTLSNVTVQTGLADGPVHTSTQSAPIESSHHTRIDRRERLSTRELVNEYVIPGRPVIVKDAAADWPAMDRFTFEFFRKRYGHLIKTIGKKTYSLAEAIDLILESTPENPAPYPINFNIETFFPELLRELKPDLVYGLSDRVNHPLLPRILFRGTEVYELFFGGRGAAFPHIHYDALCLSTQITQIVGSKEFYLYPPDQGRYMYPRPDHMKTSQIDFAKPDLERFPLFAEATPIVVTVEPRETIFFPSLWWHATRIHEPCISYGKVQLNRSNWHLYASDVENYWRPWHPWFGKAAHFYLRGLGQLIDIQERFAVTGAKGARLN